MGKFITETKTIKELLHNPLIRFVIPTYQRPYVWDNEEILKLLENIQDSRNEANYFIGNVYVNQTAENTFDIIDGQQRFITFWLTAVAFRRMGIRTPFDSFLEQGKNLRLSFPIRKKVEYYLKNLLHLNYSDLNSMQNEDDDFLIYIAKGVQTIEGFLQQQVLDKELLSNFFYEKVTFIFNVAPQNTDLNALFTALGNSGVQLEQTDILKAQLLKKIDNRVLYSKIWEACENMNDYFENNILSIFSKTDKRRITKDTFRFYCQDFLFEEEQKNEVTGKSIEEIILEKSLVKNKVDKNNSLEQRCDSIIPFSVLLLHTYRIFRHKNDIEDFNLPFDKKHLLLIFSNLIEDPDKIKSFFELLWKVRFLFDKHIVKWATDENEESINDEKKLRLSDIYESENSFVRQNKSSTEMSMLQSVMYFTGGYNQQYWLTPYLSYLLDMEDENNIIVELEKIDNLMLPGEKKNISWKLISEVERNKKAENIKIGDNLGTKFNHYWFYKLEYLLWKDWKDRGNPKFKNYRITSKNSIEHVFPQNHEFGNKLENEDTSDWLNDFGNLGLLSVGQNSSYSNQDVGKKKIDFDNKTTYDSLKLAKIYSSSNIHNWGIGDIYKHEKEMLSLIDNHYNKTQMQSNYISIINETGFNQFTNQNIIANNELTNDDILARLKIELRDISVELGLNIEFTDPNSFFGKKDTGFWFYKIDWKYCIYFCFGGERKYMSVSIDDRDYGNRCDEELRKKIRNNFKDFVIKQKDLSLESEMWKEKFTVWDSTSWNEVLRVIPIHITEWCMKILSKLKELNLY